MKKLLILMLVLGMTSMASAAISFEAPGLFGGWVIMAPGDLLVDVVSSDDQPWDGFIAVTIRDVIYGDFGPVAQLAAAGSNATVVDHGAFDIYAHITQIGAACLDPENYDVVAGTQFQTTVTYEGCYVLEILLLSDGLATVDNIQIMTPEPATLALLGLGALAILRRRK